MQHLLQKYGRLTALREAEAEIFNNLGRSRREYQAGDILVASDLADPDQLYIVDEGRFFASLELAGGERAITRLYFPGDIMGTANIPFEHATQSITANTEATVYTFPRQSLVDAFARMPRVAAIFYTFAALENAILNDRLVSVGRTRGRARLAALLLEIASREHLVDDEPQSICRPLLTQEQIGDAIGLTVVQVSRLFKILSEENLIERTNGQIRLLDRARLEEMGQFRDRYADLDLSWFSEPAIS